MCSRNVFDLIAVTVRVLQDNLRKADYEAYGALSQTRSDSINRMLTGKFPDLFPGGNACRMRTRELEEEGESLYDFLEECRCKKEYDVLIRMLSKLDIGLSDYLRDFMLTARKEVVLNDNEEETGIQILPRCSCPWVRASGDKNSSYSLNNYLKYFYFIDLDCLDSYTVEHVLITGNLEDAKEEGRLKVGSTPLYCGAELMCSFGERDGVNYFQVGSVSEEENLKRYAVQQLELAIEKGIHIMCYPEMLGTDQVLTALKDRLREFPQEGQKNPLLTICPTHWEDHSNTCIILDETGSQIGKAQKQHAFPYTLEGQVYNEDIYPDHVIQVIHCEGIGRIAVLVCKDAVVREYLQMVLEILKITLLIVPAFSTGYFDFQEKLQICRSYDCCALWINSCSVETLGEAVKPGNLDTIGIAVRIGKKGELKGETRCFKRPRRCGESAENRECGKCIYVEKLYFKSLEA